MRRAKQRNLANMREFLTKRKPESKLPTFDPDDLTSHFVDLFSNCGEEEVLMAIVNACEKEIETLDSLCATSRMPFFPRDRETYGIIKRKTLNTLAKLEMQPPLKEYDDMIERPDAMPEDV